MGIKEKNSLFEFFPDTSDRQNTNSVPPRQQRKWRTITLKFAQQDSLRVVQKLVVALCRKAVWMRKIFY